MTAAPPRTEQVACSQGCGNGPPFTWTLCSPCFERLRAEGAERERHRMERQQMTDLADDFRWTFGEQRASYRAHIETGEWE